MTVASADGLEAVLDEQDLRAAIAAALVASPLEEQSLRRGVWTYVGAQRQAGASPGRVIVQLTELVEAARVEPISDHNALMRRVILWCVEAYFGHLGGDVVGQNGRALADYPTMTAKDAAET